MGAKKVAYFVTFLASLSSFIVRINLLGYGAVQDAIIVDLGFTLIESGFLVSVFLISYSAMQIPGGYIADRVGGERTIALFVTIAAFAALAFSQVTTFALAFALRIILGFATGTLWPAAVRVVSEHLAGRSRDIANGLLGTGVGVSQLVVFTLLPVVSTYFDWRMSLLLVALMTSSSAAYGWIVTSVFRKSIARKYSERTRIPITFRHFFTRNSILIILVNMAGISVSIATLTWASLQLQSIFEITPIEAGQVVSSVGVLTIISSVTGGMATRFMGRRYVVIASMTITTLAAASLSAPLNLFIAFISIGALGLGAFLYLAPILSLVPMSAPAGGSRPGLLFAVINTIANAGAFFPVFLMGVILDFTGSYTYAYAVIIIVALVGLAAALLLRFPGVEVPIRKYGLD